MRIAIITSNPAGIYSGGRYLSLIMAYSLARVGETVIYATDNVPMFDADFAEYEAQFPIQKVVDKNFAFPDLGPLDWVIVIPTGGISDVVYSAGARCAAASGARISLMSFESPNWFNSLAPHKRSGLPWEAWRKCVAQGGLVLTIAREGIAPAREFYRSPNHRAKLEYAFWHPPINDLVADKVPPAKGPRDRVVAFVRTQDPHKGAADLLRLDPHVLKGKLLSPVFGRSVEAPYLDALKRHYSHAGVAIEPHDRISDREKFELLAQTQLLLFPSYFEGFGYPVVEAAYMGAPSVAYDLPVVRETVGEAAIYVPPGDHAAFSRAVAEALEIEPGPQVRAKLRIDPDTLSAGLKLQRLLKSHLKLVTPFKNAPSPVQVEAAPRADVLADAVVQSHWRAASAGHRFRDVSGIVSAGGLVVSGKVETRGQDATLRVTFEGRRLPEVATVKSSKPEVKSFAVEQAIDAVDSIEARCRLELVENGEPTASQVVPLRFTSEALFRADAWAGGSARQAFGVGGERVVLVSELARFVAGGRETLALSELAARFRARGLPVTLILETDRPAEAFADCDVEADLLPLVDMVEAQPKGYGAAMAASADVGGARVTVVGAGDLLADLAADADLVLELGVGLQPVVIRRFAERRPGNGPATIDYVPTLLASRAEARATKRRLVVVGAAPGERSPDWRRLFETVLPEVAGELASAKVTVHRDLLARMQDGGLLKTFAEASGWSVSAGDFPQFVEEARASAHMAAVDVGTATRDGRLAALQSSLGIPLVALAEADDAACVEAIKAALASAPAALEANSPLGVALAEGWPRPSATDLLHRHALARAALAAENAEGAGFIQAAALGVGETLALSAQSEAEADFLVSGWEPRYVDGSAMAPSGALIAFSLKDRPSGTVTLELLIRSKAPKNTMLKCAVALNGQEIGAIALDRAVSKMFAFPVPARLWRPSGLQLLSFKPEPVEIEGAVHTPSLIGLALMTYPTATDWTTFDKDMPIVEMSRLTSGASYPMRFGFRGEGGDHEVLGRGWGAQEPWHVWSIEPVAAVMASGEPTEGRPALVTIEAGALITEAHPSQRLSLEVNGASLGERRITVGFPTRLAFAIPPADLEFGLEGLLLRMPDCVRPKDLGLSADARQLGVSLTELAIETSDAEPSTCLIEPAPGGGAAARLSGFGRRSAILRLAGPGGNGTVVVTQGPSEIRAPALSSAGSWEAWIGLDNFAASPALVARFEPGDGAEEAVALDAARLWPIGAETESPIDVSIDFKPTISLDRLLARPSALLTFGAEDDGAVLGEGWSVAEGDFRWSQAPAATVDLTLAKPALDFMLLRFEVAPFIARGIPRQSVRLSRGAGELAVATLTCSGKTEVGLAIDPATGGPGLIGLQFPDARSPQSIGVSADMRQLGVQIFGLAVANLEADRVVRVAVNGLRNGWTATRSATASDAVIVELEGSSEAAPSHLGLKGRGVYAAVTQAEGRASAILILPKDSLESEEQAVIVEAVVGEGGGLIDGDDAAEVRLRVREDA